MNILRTSAETLAYYYRRNSWMFVAPFIPASNLPTRITKPIFLLGNQGDGVTLISRFLRRHPDVVSVTGNSDYWTGADEMQRAMEYRLPPCLRLSGRILNSDPEHPTLTMPRSWSYGCDELYRGYLKTEVDYTDKARATLVRVIKECVYRFGKTSTPRFVDKSQTYTLKTRYLQSLLEDADPHFVLITRNPYASCFRAASGKAGDMRRYSRTMPFSTRFQLCIQHWNNCMSTILLDAKHLKHFHHWRYEDFLAHPEPSTKQLCDFLDLKFSPDMLPSANHRIPFGTRYGDRWHPLRPHNNTQYIQRQSKAELHSIEKICGETAENLGYLPPTI